MIWDIVIGIKEINGTGNRLPETNLEINFSKEFWNLNFESCNWLPDACNRLPIMELLKFKLKSHDSSKYNCNQLPETCNRLPLKNFRKSFLKSHISVNHFEKARRAYIYVCLTSKSKRDILRELHCQMLSQKKLLGKHLKIH